MESCAPPPPCVRVELSGVEGGDDGFVATGRVWEDGFMICDYTQTCATSSDCAASSQISCQAPGVPDSFGAYFSWNHGQTMTFISDKHDKTYEVHLEQSSSKGVDCCKFETLHVSRTFLPYLLLSLSDLSFCY